MSKVSNVSFLNEKVSEMSKIEFRVVDPANYTDVLLAAAIMAASAQSDDGPAKLVLTNIHSVLDGTWHLDETYVLGIVDGRPCCVTFGDKDEVEQHCIPFFRDTGVTLESLNEMKSILAMA